MASVKSSKPSKAAAPVEKLFGGRTIEVRGAREHNLKNVDLTIPRDKLVVFTGLSGSGKSSLAFDTIYAEGQRRYVESLSAYARQFLEMMQKPDVDQIDGLSPAIAIEQKTTSKNPRSTVGTVTEIHDYMRLLVGARRRALFARHRPAHREPDGEPDGRSRARPARARAALSHRAGGARPQGRISQGDRRIHEARLPAREDRRRLLRNRRRARARQEAQARHRSRRRSPDRAAGYGEPPRRKLRDRAGARRRSGDRRIRRSPSRGWRAAPHPLLLQIRLPRLRLHHPRDRAAAVLVQQSLRRLPGLRRTRLRTQGRRGTGRSRSAPDPSQGRRRPLGEIDLALLPADAGGARAPLQVPPRRALVEPAGKGARGRPQRFGRRGSALRL